MSRHETVRGTWFRLLVDDSGTWYAEAPGFSETTHQTRQQLIHLLKAKTSQARVKVSIPFVRYDEHDYKTLRRGTATGISAQNGAVLVRWEDGKTGQVGSSYSDGGPNMADLSEEEMAEAQRLRAAREKGIRDWREFELEHRIELRRMVEAAVKDAAAAKALAE